MHAGNEALRDPMNSRKVVRMGLLALGILAVVLSIISSVASPELAPQLVSLPENGPADTRLQDLHLLLPDDVLITMRVSKFFLAHGYPGFNVSDLSQPATSYLLPVILAPVFYFLSDNAALTVVILLGVASIIGSAFLVARSRRSLDPTLVMLVAALLLNATTLSYLYSGWEHLPEGFMCGLCCYWVLRKKPSYLNAARIGLFGATAVLLRIDAVLLVGPILVGYALSNKRGTAAVGVLCATALIAIYACLQWHWFHNFFPTTARLKANYLVPVSYQARYWLRMLWAGTAAGFIPVLLVSNWKRLLRSPLTAKAMIAGVVLSYCYAGLVSDVFFGARMYLPALVVCIIVIASLDGAASEIAPEVTLSSTAKAAYAVLFLLSVGNILWAAFIQRIVTPLENSTSLAAQQLVLSRYIKANLTPSDGAVGVFWLGTVSFALPEYEIADFLGKADEQIAQLRPKWGPPGHNKWDIEHTLRKWNPAVIVSPVPLPFAEARERLAAHRFYAFFDDAATSDGIRENYRFCIPYDGLNWGLFVRNDLYQKLAESCKTVQSLDL
jgi:hypothetical protein